MLSVGLAMPCHFHVMLVIPISFTLKAEEGQGRAPLQLLHGGQSALFRIVCYVILHYDIVYYVIPYYSIACHSISYYSFKPRASDAGSSPRPPEGHRSAAGSACAARRPNHNTSRMIINIQLIFISL